MTAFARFPARLQEAIVSRLGWTALRPVQELAGEAILDGKNAVVLAPTAGGKTEASMFPALVSTRQGPRRRPATEMFPAEVRASTVPSAPSRTMFPAEVFRRMLFTATGSMEKETPTPSTPGSTV